MNQSSSPTPQQQLFCELDRVLQDFQGALYFKPTKTANFLRYSLENNKHYTPEFWNQSDEDGNHVFLSLSKRSTLFLELYDLFKKDAPHLVAQENPHTKECLLHVVWKALSDNPTYTKEQWADLVKDIQHQTPKEQWTWLDGPDSQKGQGWLDAIVKISQNPHPALVDVASNISKQFGHRPPPGAWLKVSTVDQADVLYSSNASLNDVLVFEKGIGVPAWQYFLSMRDNRNSIPQAIEKGHFPDINMEEAQQYLEEVKVLEKFKPKDNRAKIGYVKLCLAHSQKNALGLSSLHYLFSYRSDLLPLLVSEMRALMSKDGVQAVSDFFKPDKMGFSLLSHALRVLSPSSFASLKKMYVDFNIPIDLSEGPRGWFAREMEYAPWLAMSKAANSHSLQSFPQVLNMTQNMSPNQLFGDLTQQQVWEKKWESYLGRLKDYSNVRHPQGNKENRPPRMVARQILAFLTYHDNHSLNENNFSPRLHAQLTLAVHFLSRVRKLDDILSTERAGRSTFANSRALPIPTVFTSGMGALLGHEVFSIDKGPVHREENASWHAALEKYNISEEIKDLALKKYPSTRTNKM